MFSCFKRKKFHDEPATNSDAVMIPFLRDAGPIGPKNDAKISRNRLMLTKDGFYKVAETPSFLKFNLNSMRFSRNTIKYSYIFLWVLSAAMVCVVGEWVLVVPFVAVLLASIIIENQ